MKQLCRVILTALLVIISVLLAGCQKQNGYIVSSRDVINENKNIEEENDQRPDHPEQKTEQETTDEADEAPYRLSFHSDFPYREYAGKQVYIRGYMSTLSPLDGSYVYVMNLPYQNCPYCEPNSTAITVTVTAYAPPGKSFEFYDGAIEMTGIMELGSFKDGIGYSYEFRLVDASYTKLDMSAISENMRVYGRLTNEGVLPRIIAVTNATDFNAFYSDYGADVSEVKPVERAEYDSLIADVNAVDPEIYNDLTLTLDAFADFNDAVNANIAAGDYAANASAEMHLAAAECFKALGDWITKFEL